MDLNLFYNKMRQQQTELQDEFPIIVSHETANGGRAGQLAEVARMVAARFIVQGLARVATHEEAKIFRDAQSQAKRIADEVLEASKFQLAMLATRGIERLQERVRPQEPKQEAVKE